MRKRHIPSISKEDYLEKQKQSFLNTTVEYHLGCYVGEDIVRKTLPTLSCFSIQTNNIIQVTEEEHNKIKELSNIWFTEVSKYSDKYTRENKVAQEEWKNYREYSIALDEKYYPKTIHHQMPPMNIPNMEEFKKGIIHTLWDCDCCSYSLKEEDIVVQTNHDYSMTQISFILNIDKRII